MIGDHGMDHGMQVERRRAGQERLPAWLRLPETSRRHAVENRREVLKAVIETADGVAERPNAIPALVALTRLVGRAFASEHMLQQVGGSAVTLLGDWRELAHRYKLPSESGLGERVWLGLDPVVAVPWSTSRLIGSLSRLSLGPPGRPCDAEPWSYDSRNHRIRLWLPMRLAEVWDGNHSVVAGVLSNTGSVPARYIYDFSPLFARLSWNGGLSWTDSESGGIAQVGDWRLAALFELGRRLHDRGFNGRSATSSQSRAANDEPELFGQPVCGCQQAAGGGRSPACRSGTVVTCPGWIASCRTQRSVTANRRFVVCDIPSRAFLNSCPRACPSRKCSPTTRTSSAMISSPRWSSVPLPRAVTGWSH